MVVSASGANLASEVEVTQLTPARTEPDARVQGVHALDKTTGKVAGLR